VNIESAAVGDHKSDDPEESPQSRLATETNEKIFKDMIKDLEGLYGSQCDYQLDYVRSTRFTFVSMRDYLANYDWRGEFTEEEIRPWM
jgi:hypothetical protein